MMGIVNRYIFLFSSLFILQSFYLFAQNSNLKPRTKWGLDFKSSSDVQLESVIRSSDDLTYTIRSKSKSNIKNTLLIDKLDKRLNLLESIEKELKYYEHDLNFIQTLELGDDIVIFSTYYNEEDHEKVLVFQTLNKYSLEFENNQEEWAKINANENPESSTFFFNVSPSGEYISISANENDKIKVWCYSHKYRYQWENEIKSSIEINPFNHAIDDLGTFSVLNSEKDKVWLINESSQTERDLSIGAFKVQNECLVSANNQLLLVVGSFSSRSSDEIRGYFSRVINTSNQSASIEDELYLEEDLSMKKVDLKIFKQEDDSYLLLAEERDLESNQVKKKAESIFKYGNIHAIQINSNLKFGKSFTIEKSQILSEENRAYGSYFQTQIKDHNFFFYNAHSDQSKPTKKNEDIPSFTANDRDITICAIVSPEGEVSYLKLFNFLQTKSFFDPKSAFELRDKSILISGDRDKTFRYGRIEFPVLRTSN